MGIHLVAMGNDGFPPLWQLGKWLPETGRKMGACGKCSTRMETLHDSIIHGNAKRLVRMFYHFNDDGHRYSFSIPHLVIELCLLLGLLL